MADQMQRMSQIWLLQAKNLFNRDDSNLPFDELQIEIKRIIHKGLGQSKDFKIKKIFVGGIPPSVSEDELKNFFFKYVETAKL
ncbi:hypothetical protein QYF36_008445 [Acer negundo]|nr:hypothetical protein QYF36_008445 [Acer negundo]